MSAQPDLQALGISVSRETIERLEHFQTLLLKWTARINLISRGTQADIWSRHIVDSAQLWACLPDKARHWFDIGSGGGLPGLVIAILAKDLRPSLWVHLIDSDVRKTVFLQTVIRTLDLNAKVSVGRVEKHPPEGADVVSARAVAPLKALLGLTTPHAAPNGLLLLPKGATYASEVAALDATMRARLRILPSKTQPGSVILCVHL